MSRLVARPPRRLAVATRRFAVVDLGADQLRWAAEVGSARQIGAIRRGLDDKHGFEGAAWDAHIEGAAGELAASIALGLRWPATVDTFKSDGDIGPGVQVRTRSEHHYDLIVRSDDADGDRFILVTGRAPTYRIHGWISGADAKQPGWRKVYGGRPLAYFCPASFLHHLQDFRR